MQVVGSRWPVVSAKGELKASFGVGIRYKTGLRYFLAFCALVTGYKRTGSLEFFA